MLLTKPPFLKQNIFLPYLCFEGKYPRQEDLKIDGVGRRVTEWLKNYGKDLNDELKLTNGVINNIIGVVSNNTVKLNDSKSLTILINDTQKTYVYIVDNHYIFNPSTGYWEATITVNVTDNFGLDDGDVIDFWYHIGGPGFVSWWILQHRKNYWPFQTDLWFTVKFNGNINNT